MRNEGRERGSREGNKHKRYANMNSKLAEDSQCEEADRKRRREERQRKWSNRKRKRKKKKKIFTNNNPRMNMYICKIDK